MNNYRDIASNGRLGATELRNINGELSHVNLLEAYLTDAHGRAGEEVVKNLGSGTINPETGLREYWWWLIPVAAALWSVSALTAQDTPNPLSGEAEDERWHGEPAHGYKKNIPRQGLQTSMWDEITGAYGGEGPVKPQRGEFDTSSFNLKNSGFNF